MSPITIVHIHDDITSVFEVKEKRKRYTVFPPKQFTQSYEVSQYLKSKKNVYFLFFSDNIIEESITLPEVIKNEETIQSALLAKIHDRATTTDKVLLNRLNTTLDATQESAVYRYEGLYEKDVLEHIAFVPKHAFLRRISTERHALYSLAQYAFNGKSYLCVYTEEKRNLIVAVHNGVLLFGRVGFIQSEDETERSTEQISDITRTVAYAHQQYREAKFEFIAICGSITDSEILPLQLQASTGLKITVLAPNLIVDGLDTKIAQNTILEIGMLFLDKNMNFLPNSVKAAREVYLASGFAIFVAFLFMLFGLFQSYEAYTAYQDSLDEYNRVEIQLSQTLRNTNALDNKQLQEITAQLKSSTPLHHHLIDDLILFEPVLTFIKPKEVSFSEGGELIFNFKYQCKTLMELYLFEKNFRHKVSTITAIQATPSYKTDYNTLTFEATLKTDNAEESSQQPVDEGAVQ